MSIELCFFNLKSKKNYIIINKILCCRTYSYVANEAVSRTSGLHFSVIVYSLWPCDAIWRPRSGSKLAQVMACCLTEPNHYLNQSWPITNAIAWHSFDRYCTGNTIYKPIANLKMTNLRFQLHILIHHYSVMTIHSRSRGILPSPPQKFDAWLFWALSTNLYFVLWFGLINELFVFS